MDHPVRARQHIRWDRKSDLLGRLEIDYQLEFGRLLDWKIRRFDASEDLIDEVSGTPIQIGEIRSVGHESADLDKLLFLINYRHSVFDRGYGDGFFCCQRQPSRGGNHGADSFIRCFFTHAIEGIGFHFARQFGKRNLERARGSSDFVHLLLLTGAWTDSGPHENTDPAEFGNNLFEALPERDRRRLQPLWGSSMSSFWPRPVRHPQRE